LVVLSRGALNRLLRLEVSSLYVNRVINAAEAEQEGPLTSYDSHFLVGHFLSRYTVDKSGDGEVFELNEMAKGFTV
jgi:hypothetical protein